MRATRFCGVGRRVGARTGSLGEVIVVLALISGLLGCATTAPPSGEPESRTTPARDRWSCQTLAGTTSEPWYGGLKTWREDAGTMTSVHGSPWGRGEAFGQATEEGAVREALGSAASAALDLLERRGLPYASDRRAEIEARTVETLLDGGEPPFPRVRIGGAVVEHCVDEETGEGSWRAQVLIEYPIGHLRGDVANARWERERLLREVEVLRASAAAHFARGRWLDGRLDLGRALELLAGSGTSLSEVPAGTDLEAGWGDPDATQAQRVLWHSREIRGTSAALSIEPLGRIDVVEIGARGGAEVEFLVSCAWEGGRVPAVGVPMRYETRGGAAAILDGDPVTDGSGVARCRILRAYGDPGEYELVAAVDADLVRSAGVEGSGEFVVRADGPEGGRTPYRRGPEASRSFFLVEGGHGVSLCTEFEAERDRDASQARAGFVHRMERDGYRMEACGPDVDVVVFGEVELVTVVEPGSWATEARIEGGAFDQRFARDIDRTVITVAETSSEGQRDAELLALREAGRLLAVYLSRRILTSGE